MSILIALLLISATTAVLLAVLNRHDGLPWVPSQRTPPQSHPRDFLGSRFAPPC